MATTRLMPLHTGKGRTVGQGRVKIFSHFSLQALA